MVVPLNVRIPITVERVEMSNFIKTVVVPLNVRIPITVERVEMSNFIKKFVGTSSNTSSSRIDEQLR